MKSKEQIQDMIEAHDYDINIQQQKSIQGSVEEKIMCNRNISNLKAAKEMLQWVLTE